MTGGRLPAQRTACGFSREVQVLMVTEHGDGSLDIDGRLPIEAFAARVGEVLTQGERDADIDTICGLVFTLAGRVPGRGEAIGHPIRCGVPHPGSDARPIRRLRVRRAPAQSQPAARLIISRRRYASDTPRQSSTSLRRLGSSQPIDFSGADARN